MKKLLKSKLFLQVVVASMLATLATAGIVGAVTTIGANINTAGTLDVTGLSTFLGGATTTTLKLLHGEIISNATDGVIQLGGISSTTSLTLLHGESITNAVDGTIQLGGISSTTSLTLLHGESITNAVDGTISFGAANLSTTGTLASGALTVTGATSISTTLSAATTTISTGLIVDTDTLLVDGINNRVGIGSTTPTTNLSVGTATATSTISTGKFCMFAVDQINRGYWITLNLAAANAAGGIFATSTIPCNQ